MAEQRDPRVDGLMAYVDQLRQRVETLQAALDGARQSTDLSMRKWLRCPVCGCRRIAHAMSVLDRGDGDMRKNMALVQPAWWSSKTLGELEAYVCTACGFLEWYAKDPSELKDAKKYMRIIEGENEVDGGGPYR